MAATSTTTTTTRSTSITVSTTHFKSQTKPSKPKHKKCRPSKSITSGDHRGRNLDPPHVVSHEGSWCCPASSTAPKPRTGRVHGGASDPRAYPGNDHFRTRVPTKSRQPYGGASRPRARFVSNPLRSPPSGGGILPDNGSACFSRATHVNPLYLGRLLHDEPAPTLKPRLDPAHGGASVPRENPVNDFFRVRPSLESQQSHGGASPPRAHSIIDPFRNPPSIGGILPANDGASPSRVTRPKQLTLGNLFHSHDGASPSRASPVTNPFGARPSQTASTAARGGASPPRATSVIAPTCFLSYPAMDFAGAAASPPPTAAKTHESGFYKFNSALTAGLLNPMSPPPAADKARSSPTLFEMMANEPEIKLKTLISNPKPPTPTVHDRQALAERRVAEILASTSPGSRLDDARSSDVRLTLGSKDGVSVSLSVHRQVLVAHSRFFAVKLSDRWAREMASPPYVVEIADCEDVEVYVETLRLMYCKDLRRRLMKEDVPKVLGILKVSAAIGFDAGVLTCLEFLEAAPWAEDEEDKVASLLSELRLEGVGAGEVLKRVSLEAPNVGKVGSENEGVLLKLINVVLEGKDEKARREMKMLVSKMLHENSNSSHSDLRKDALYSSCGACLSLLRRSFLSLARSEAAQDREEAGQVARQADNLHWILDILIDRQIGEDFLKTWASESELAGWHCKVPAVHRHEVSRVTARLFVGIGKGQLLVSKEARLQLLQTWLGPFYDDFGWMRRGAKGLDRNLIEDGLTNTILTLPLACQQEILLAWFNRFLNSGEDCPNIQRGFEVWWRRAFWRRNGEPGRLGNVRIPNAAIEHHS